MLLIGISKNFRRRPGAAANNPPSGVPIQGPRPPPTTIGVSDPRRLLAVTGGQPNAMLSSSSIAMTQRSPTADSHRAYSRDGVQLALGRHWRDGIVHVVAVEDGAACGCVCPACGRNLIAREGSRRRHFAHAKLDATGDEDFQCDGGQMTALHRFAQQLIVDRMTLELPPVAAGFGEERLESHQARRMTFTTAAMEKSLKSLRPDVTLMAGESTLYVEVYVTHASTPEKVAVMREAGRSLLEIDLSKTDRDIDLPGLEDWILYRAPRKWLYNRHIDDIEVEIAARREERRRAKAAQEERELVAASAKLKREYERAERTALGDNPQADSDVRRAAEGGWKHLISGFGALAPGLFTVHPEKWRCLILTSILRNHQRLSADEITRILSREKVVNHGLHNRSPLEWRAAAIRAGIPTLDAVIVVEDYLAFLKRSGAADDDGGDWRRDPSVHQLILAQEQREEDKVLEDQRRRERIERFVALMKDLRRRLPAEIANDFQEREHSWRDAPFGGSSPLRIAVEGGNQWDSLTKALSDIAACMQDGANGTAPSTLGLPHVGDAMERAILVRQKQILERQERDRLRIEEEAHRIELQAKSRASAIRQAASDRLFEGFEVWLATVVPEANAIPEDMARRSVDGLHFAYGALDRAVTLQKQKIKALEGLETFAELHVSDAEKRWMLLSNVHPKLPGRTSMLAYCRDAGTLQKCKDIIKPPKSSKR